MCPAELSQSAILLIDPFPRDVGIETVFMLNTSFDTFPGEVVALVL